MEQKKYFYVPTQVMFFDPDSDGNWIAGIAYKDEIICGCCGGIFEISELYEMFAPDDTQLIYEFADWLDISDEIKGGELPENFPN